MPEIQTLTTRSKPYENRSCSMIELSFLPTQISEDPMFSVHPTHQEAKRQYARWYKGYYIVVSEVIRSYGDDNFPHITPNRRSALTSRGDR